MAEETAGEIIAAIRLDLDQSADAILSAAERALRDIAAARSNEITAFIRIEDALSQIMQACAFQDLTGQRLSKLSAAIDLSTAARDDALLNGPALAGQGLDQAAADALMADIFAASPAPES